MEQIEGVDEPVVMVHDYHLYTLPGLVRRARPTSSCTTSSTSRGRSPMPGACCPRASAREIYEGLLANDIIGFHTRSYRWNFLQCCRDLMDLDVDFERGVVARSTAARCGSAPTRCRSTTRRPAPVAARDARRASSRSELLARRREYSILRVDRADLSKNVLRGFSAFDLFLEQHPEFPSA